MSGGAASQDVAQRREAARALLRTPVLTAAEDAEELAMVRRHAAALKSTFATLLGYPLFVESKFARLMKAPLADAAPVRAAHRASGGEFTARTYVFVALLCAALLAPEVGEQVLVSTLVGQLRADASTAGIDMGDTIGDQRQLVAAFRQLLTWGVIEETAGTVTAWGERREEALLTVHRAVLPHLLARRLADLDGPAALLAVQVDPVEQPRRSLRRKLVENPLVRREDLTDAELDVLSRERTELTRVLDDAFGLVVEVRAEGAIAYDPDRELSDIEFPGTGTVKQAALLLIDALLQVHQPAAGAVATVSGRTSPGQLCAWAEVDALLADLSRRYAKVWGADYVKDPGRLRDDTVALLAAVSLATPGDTGLVVHPAAARYRPHVQPAPARTRAQARLELAEHHLFDPAVSGTAPETP